MKNTCYLILVFFCMSPLLKGQESADSLNHYIQNFHFKKALQWLDGQATSKDREFQRAMCYKSLGENKQATTVLAKLAEEYPEDVRVKTELAQAYERSSRWGQSADVYANLMAIDSTNLFFLIKKSESEINRKNYRSAVGELQTVLQRDSLMSAMRLLGKTYENMNKLDSAALYYNLAWSADSADVFSASNLVNVLLKEKKYFEALGTSQRYLEFDSTNKQMNMLNGYAHYAIEDYDMASIILEKCFMDGDSSLVVSRSLGMSYFFKNDSECAYEYLSRAQKADSTNATVMYNLAVSAYDIDKPTEAIDYHSKLLDKLIPSDMQLYLNYRGLALAYEKEENYDEAIKYYLKTSEYATTDQRMYLYYGLGKIYEEHIKNYTMAIMYYKQYKTALNAYVINIKSNEHPADMIAQEEAKLKELDKHLLALGSAKDDPETKSAFEPSEVLYVYEGEVVDQLPTPQRFMDLDNAPPEIEDYVNIAKEQGKKGVLFVGKFKKKVQETESTATEK